MKGYLKQVHPVLPVQNVMTALFFYVHKLGFELVFADDDTKPQYAGVRRDGVEIHLQWHDPREWENEIDRPMLRFVTKNIDALYQEFKAKEVFHKDTALKETHWGTKEFGFFDVVRSSTTH